MLSSLDNPLSGTDSLVFVFNITSTDMLVNINQSAPVKLFAFSTQNSTSASSLSQLNTPLNPPGPPLYTPNIMQVNHSANNPESGFIDGNNWVKIEERSGGKVISFNAFNLPTLASDGGNLFMYIFLNHLYIINTEGIVLLTVDVAHTAEM